MLSRRLRLASSRPGRLVLAGLLFAGVLASAAPIRAQTDAASSEAVASVVKKALGREALQNGFWGVKIMDAVSGDVIYGQNTGKRFVPASNAKLFTAAAALDQLGPGYRFVTRLYKQGAVTGDTLHGDLLVRGAGDPTIGGYEQRDDRLQVFRAWADSLKAAGIRHVTGRVIGDDDIHSDTPLGNGWSWDDLPYRFAVELSGLPFGENVIELTARGQSLGAPAALSWEPLQTRYVNVVNHSRTVRRGSDEEYRRLPGSRTLYVESRIRPGRVQEEELSVANPTGYFASVLRSVLLRSGIAVDGPALDIDDLSEKPTYGAPFTREVARYRSAPLADVLSTTLEESQNLYAEQILRTLGAERPTRAGGPDTPKPGSSAMGVEAAMRTFAAASVDTSRLRLADGSGLSRYDLVTPNMTARLLQYMRQHPDPAVRDAFVEALPVGGREGTLEYRFRRGPAYGNVRAKTGTLSGVSALSGYVTAGERPLIFVIIGNHFSGESRTARHAQDRIVQALAAGEF